MSLLPPISFEVWPPAEGSIFHTTIFNWNLEDGSFWRVPSMSIVIDIAKSISMIGWKEELGL